MSTSVQPIGRNPERWQALQRRMAEQPAYVLITILVILMIATNVVSPHFLTLRGLSTTLLFAAFLGTLAAGQTLVMLTGGIDLSIANTATAASYLMAAFSAQGHGLVVSLLAGLALGLLIGLINGVGIGVFGVQPLIMTLGMAGIITGGLTVYSQEYFKGAPAVPSAVHQLGAGTIGNYLPISLLLVWLPLALILILGLRHSGLGRAIYAVGDNPIACRLTGVRVWQVLIATYALCAVLGALSGYILLGYVNAPDVQLASGYLLVSVAAVVIGGTSIFGGSGGYGGTVLGALILTVLDTLLTGLNASEAVRQILYGGIILFLATIYSRAFGGE